MRDRLCQLGASLVVGSAALAMGACQQGETLRFENRTGSLMTVRIEARGGRTMSINIQEPPNAEALGQERYADRPAGGLRGLSADGSTFGPMRINPGEIVSFQIQNPSDVTPSAIRPGDEAIWFQVSPILSRRETVLEYVLFEPLPPQLVLVESSGGYRFEVPTSFAPTFETPAPRTSGRSVQD